MKNIIDKSLKVIGVVAGLVLFGSSECMNIPRESAKQHKLDELTEKHKSELKRSKVYIAVTVHNHKSFIPNLRKTLEANVSELTQHGVQPHVIITCDGIEEDFYECNKQFSGFPLPSENLEILLKKRDESFYKAINDRAPEFIKEIDYLEDIKCIVIDNEAPELIKEIDDKCLEYFKKFFVEPAVGVSLARWSQLNHIHELIKQDYNDNLSPYFFLFDGDDIAHKDLLLIELLGLLETGAKAAHPGYYADLPNIASSGNIVRCKNEDKQKILERASRDIDEFLIKAPSFGIDCLFILFKGEILETVLSEGYEFYCDGNKRIDPMTDFVWLIPIIHAVPRDPAPGFAKVYLLDTPGEKKYEMASDIYDFTRAPFFNEQIEQNSLFFYMQHDDSIMGRFRTQKPTSDSK